MGERRAGDDDAGDGDAGDGDAEGSRKCNRYVLLNVGAPTSVTSAREGRGSLTQYSNTAHVLRSWLYFQLENQLNFTTWLTTCVMHVCGN